ncbi:Hypothetical protein, putative [Bodo saltans]|uniref:Uncharacterized protein n=1 Tax=Bodo saltans TaxID=75058 RepID=A0A0S4J3L4_BODSA|nr:Hypothetical protein, putative [Bodo saltans]|eukprot:CUG86019.1 Hypothetical protein, putative [Bodo saltans]
MRCCYLSNRVAERASMLVAGAQQLRCSSSLRRNDPVFRDSTHIKLWMTSIHTLPSCADGNQRTRFETPHQKERRRGSCRRDGGIGATGCLCVAPIVAATSRTTSGRRFLFGQTDDLFAGASQCYRSLDWMSEFMHGRKSTPSLLGGIRALHVQSLSCAFVSRSRALLSGESAIAPEVMKLFQSLHGCSVTLALGSVYVSQVGDQRKATAKLVHDTVRLSKSVLTTDRKYPCELLHGKNTVAFCAVSGDSWFVAVIAEGPKLTDDIIRSIGILRLQETDDAEDSTILFNCYSVANYSGRTECETLAKCLGESFHGWHHEPITDPWKALPKGKSNYRISMTVPNPAVVYVIASAKDWSELERRHVDFDGEQKVLRHAQHFDVTSPLTTCIDHKTIILIGGESGSGKTMHMLTGNRREAHAVVYARCVLSSSEEPENKEPEEIKKVIARVRENMGVVIALNKECSTKPDDKTAKRNELFLDVLVDLVKLAMSDANPELHEQLQKWGVGSDISKPVFRVRVCLDEIGASTAFIRACCATNPDDLRNLLGWGTRVEVRIIAGGTGVGTNSESLGSESSRFKYSIFSERGMNLYWSMRDSLDRLLDDNTFAELTGARKKLKKAWANVKERKAALYNRDVALQACIKRASNANAKLRENGEQCTTVKVAEDHASQRRLILEGLFSAVESDGACAAALTNPRLAALIAARCSTVADEIVKMELCASTSGTNIRQKILDPVARSFKMINGLKRATPRVANRLLVESLRHAAFCGYKVGAESKDAITTDALIMTWGVLVDNLVYKPEPPGDGFKLVLTANAKGFNDEKISLYGCYDKTVGRYSISPAMIVVLHALMAGAFDDTFTNIGDVFERAMAKFLFFAAQVFCGRPVSELVDFVIGPKAIVGSNANKCTTTIPTVLVRLRQCNDESAVWSGTSEEDELRRNAFVEMSPVKLPSADVVLHIPGTITLAVKCKDVGKLSSNEIRDTFRIMDYTPEESQKFELANPNVVNYPKKLSELKAPVISIVYTSRTLFLVSDDDISERFNAVGPNCILAQGIGEVSDEVASIKKEQVASSTGATGIVPTADDVRLSNIRWNLLQFDFRRRVGGEKSFDIAVSERTEPNAVAINAATYETGSSVNFTERAKAAVEGDRKRVADFFDGQNAKKFAKERCESLVRDTALDKVLNKAFYGKKEIGRDAVNDIVDAFDKLLPEERKQTLDKLRVKHFSGFLAAKKKELENLRSGSALETK